MTNPQRVHYPYVGTKTKRHLPYCTVCLSNSSGNKKDGLRFLIDTGSEVSYAPFSWGTNLFDPANHPLEKTGCTDLSGNPLDGHKVALELSLGGITVQEKIFFRPENIELRYGVLGHSDFLKNFVAIFRSWQNDGTVCLVVCPQSGMP